MEVLLNHIFPHPLQTVDPDVDSVWSRSITLRSGQNYCFEAPSGRGKTSLIQIIYGMRRDFSGELLLDGLPSFSLTSDEWSLIRREKLSIVFQDLRLFDQLSVIDNLKLKNELMGFKTLAELEEMMETLSIGHLSANQVSTLSYGQKQRVAIIRSLCQPFKFLLLDEPFSHLDLDLQKSALQLIESACKNQNSSFIMTTLGSTDIVCKNYIL